MKKTLSLIICVIVFALSLSACTETETFGAIGPGSSVKLGNYKNLTVDRKGAEYKEYFDTLHFANTAYKNCYDKMESGKVKKGDVANIDYVGTVDGVAFEGGTANGYDLTIGSGQFIDGFEDGLIGVSVGETVDLNLTFPENYDSQNLAGRDVVFKVTVNYRQAPQSPEKCYDKLGYKTLKEYKEDVDEACIQTLVVKNFIEKCKFKKYPDTDNFKATVFLNYYNKLCLKTNGMGIEEYLKSNNYTVNAYVEGVIDNLSDKAFDVDGDMKIVRNEVTAFYALFYEENLSYDKDEIANYESYEKCYKESVLIKEIVTDYLVKNAKIKG